MNYSVALTTEIERKAAEHLIRLDRQEDLCFALWHPSQGRSRKSALIREILLPETAERKVHGNASFTADYFERAIGEALQRKSGLAFLHSHPSPGWQGMSQDDINAEEGHAAAVKAATGLPLVGLTIGSDGAWSARFWEKIGPRKYKRYSCQTVRVVGDDLRVTFNDNLLPPPRFRENLDRTVCSWGAGKQKSLARLHMGVIGVGSVGSIISEALARMGVVHIKLIDFDSLKLANLDRTLHGTEKDTKGKKAKVKVCADALRRSATAEGFWIEPIEWSVVEEYGFLEALDCDLLFSCVDRPWPRSVLNFIAYCHLIPVIDGGIRVRTKTNGTLRSADWKTHVVSPGRKCLECLEQYDPGLVSAERDGYLDDPTYIENLPPDHDVKRNENVFGFSLSVASLQVLQMLSFVISPCGISNIGEQNYHFVLGRTDVDYGYCRDTCLYPSLIAKGDSSVIQVTGNHPKAEAERKLRGKEKQLWRKIVSLLK
jgi:molybdopterin/thiamine biosynthesis adenylyltransferase